MIIHRNKSSIPVCLGISVFGLLWLTFPLVAQTEVSGDLDTSSATSLTADEIAICNRLELDHQQIALLKAKPLFQFTEGEVDTYLRFLAQAEPDLQQRIVHLARKNKGQPYELYLLGEMPFEHYDPQPIYCLSKSDCVVFAEHIYAMALATDWSSFMRTLQRIRYRDGKIGVATRNHFTEADWNPSNQWLVRDITQELAGDDAMVFRQTIDRAAFLKKRYGLNTTIPVERHRDVYFPFEQINRAKPHLQSGDFVNIVRGIPTSGRSDQDEFSGSAWVGHVGMIIREDNGAIHLIHSAQPAVREETLDTYIGTEKGKIAERDRAGQARLLGFKFLRLVSDPLAELRKIDGQDAPRIHLP